MPAKGQVMRPETKERIRIALKRYAAKPDSHLHVPHVSGEDHPNWKGGIAPKSYRNIGFSHHGRRCAVCGAAADLIHHRDENRRNNQAGNPQPLCRKCHMQIHHGKRVEWSVWCARGSWS